MFENAGDIPSRAREAAQALIDGRIDKDFYLEAKKHAIPSSALEAALAAKAGTLDPAAYLTFLEDDIPSSAFEAATLVANGTMTKECYLKARIREIPSRAVRTCSVLAAEIKRLIPVSPLKEGDPSLAEEIFKIPDWIQLRTGNGL